MNYIEEIDLNVCDDWNIEVFDHNEIDSMIRDFTIRTVCYSAFGHLAAHKLDLSLSTSIHLVFECVSKYLELSRFDFNLWSGQEEGGIYLLCGHRKGGEMQEFTLTSGYKILYRKIPLREAKKKHGIDDYDLEIDHLTG